jgi:hypothetical protein
VVQIGSEDVVDPGGKEVYVRSEYLRIEIERHPGIGILPRFVVIDVELLYIEVLARVALPCDSGQSDLPN